MRLDPSTAQQLYDTGWVDGHDQGRQEGFRLGYQAAVADAGDLVTRGLIPAQPGPAATTPAPSAGAREQDLVDQARRSWSLSTPADAPAT